MSEASGAFSSEEQQAGTSRVRLASPVARLGQLSVEAAKQHRLGVEADYFPKFGATFANLHYSKFLWPVGHAPSPFTGGPLIQGFRCQSFLRIKPSLC